MQCTRVTMAFRAGGDLLYCQREAMHEPLPRWLTQLLRLHDPRLGCGTFGTQLAAAKTMPTV